MLLLNKMMNVLINRYIWEIIPNNLNEKQMKQIFNLYFLVVLTSLAVSCSSSSDSDGDGPAANSGSLTVDGTSLTITSKFAQRGDNTLAISALASDDSSLELTFDSFGNLRTAIYDDNMFNRYQSYRNFNSNYFTFSLLSVNASNKTVSVSYSGKVYLNEDDLTSSFKTISGSFNLTYVEQTPIISGLGLSCKIAGTDWYETSFWDNGFDNVDRKFISSDANMIAMKFASEDITPGVYNFTPVSQNAFQLAKFNTTTLEYDFYDCTGTFTVTSNTAYPLYSIVEGTFSFTATNSSNPAQQIAVTNGVFKTNI